MANIAAATASPVRSAEWVMNYQGIDITQQIAAMILSISYTDWLTDLSGEVEIVVEDNSRKWQGSWYPGLGDQIGLFIGYTGEGLLPCGQFQIDQLELAG